MRTHRSFKAAARLGLAAVLLAASGSLTAPPSWGQRRMAEPELNPGFQEEVQGRSGEGGPISEEGAAPAEQAVPPNPFASRAPAAPAASSAQEGAEKDPLSTRVVLRVKSAPLATFLDTISAQARVSFIVSEGLEDKKISAFLQDATVREALQILLEMKGLTYQRIGKSNTYVISPRAVKEAFRVTRIYTLSYVPLVSIEGQKDYVSEPQAESEPEQVPGGEKKSESKASDIAILNVIRSVLSKQGAIAIDPRTNAVIITDVPEVFPQVEQILSELDRKAPQIIIEAQIVEIDSDRAQQLGLEWGGASGELASFTGPMRDTTFPLNLPKNLGNTHVFDPLTSVVSGISASGAIGTGGSGGGQGANGSVAAGNILRTGIVNLTQLSVVLRALITKAEARFLGKPKVLTLNNKAATIEISQDQAVSIQQTTSGGASGITSTTAGAERQQTGLVLKVTPQVNKEGYVTMLVEPSFTDVVESKISSAARPVFDPIKRSAATLVRVKSGQTLALGGLLQSRETKQVRKVPLLGYIPLIGWLFTSVSNQRSNTDLVIFITPTIVSD